MTANGTAECMRNSQPAKSAISSQQQPGHSGHQGYDGNASYDQGYCEAKWPAPWPM